MPASQPRISAIIAMSENRVIGINNALPWHLPADWKHFKAITSGHPIIMGRKTYTSIGRPLPNRTNIIITRDKNYEVPGCVVVHSISDAIEVAAKENQQEIFIIGGADVIQQALPCLQRFYLTILHQDFDGDTYFPELDASWHETQRETFEPDEKNTYRYSFITMERRQ